MKFREKWKRFWTLDRHHDEGFTLVELIVVIAILAILAGVAVPAYNGYITKSQMEADKITISNVKRAVTYAAADPSLTFFQTTTALDNVGSVPLGFIIIDQNAGITTVEINEAVDTGDVSTKTENFYYSVLIENCSGETSYEWNSRPFTYIDDESAQIKYGEVPGEGEVALLSGSQFILADSNTKIYSAGSAGEIDNALNAAYGDGYTSAVKLQYNGWGQVTASQLYTNTNLLENWTMINTVMDTVRAATEATLEITALGFIPVKGEDAMKMLQYDSTEKVIDSAIGQFDTANIAEEAFIRKWCEPNGLNEDFGFDGDGIDMMMYGTRSAWNGYLADYIAANSASDHDPTHAAYISNFGTYHTRSMSIAGFDLAEVTMLIPRVVTTSVLTSSDMEESVRSCPKCQELQKAYLKEAKNADGSYNTESTIYKCGLAYYQSMKMTNAASKDKPSNVTYGQYFSEYMGKMDSIYEDLETVLETMGDSSYVIIEVLSNNGTVEFKVLPTDADPSAS